MKSIAMTLLMAGLVLGPPLPVNADSQVELVDLRSGQTIRLADQGHALAGYRIILVGEHHTAAGHHQAQLAVIQSLVAAGQQVAVGMEMFRRDSQPSLDAWVGGQLKASAFEAVYRDNWNYPFALYQPILEFARQNRLALVGLNVPRGITRQVAREGFDSLSKQERQDLPFVTCDVDQDYMAYIRQAYGAHGHGQMNFDHFCEAQLVWDKAMAANALRFLENHPSHVIVVLAGSGHARKGGIPAQLKKMSSVKHLVILPEVPGAIDQDNLDHGDADFLIRGF